MGSESSTPTKEATKLALKICPNPSVSVSSSSGYLRDIDLRRQDIAIMIDRELNYPALLESHKQLQLMLAKLADITVQIPVDWRQDYASEISEEARCIVNLAHELVAKAKEITP